MSRRHTIAQRALLRDHQFVDDTPARRGHQEGARRETMNLRRRAGRARAGGAGSGTCQGCGLPCPMYYCESCAVNLGGEG